MNAGWCGGQGPPDVLFAGRAACDLANERRRFGYRRLFVLLRREGEPSGAREMIAAWTTDYNTKRSHSALERQTTARFSLRLTPAITRPARRN